MGRRWGQLFFRASSLLAPASKKIMAKSQILAHLIFIEGSSFWGMRLLLRLVTKPPSTIKTGKIQGALKSRKVAMALMPITTLVIVLLMEILNAFVAA